MNWQVQYQGGDGVLILAPTGLALLPGSAPDEVIAAMWALAETGAEAVEMVRALNSELPGHASCAVAVEGPAGCVVLLKGAATAVIANNELTAESAFAWSEHQVGGGGFQVVGPAYMEPGGDWDSETRPGEGGRWLPIRSGVVVAGAVRVVRRAGEATGVNEALEPTRRPGSSVGSAELPFSTPPRTVAGGSSDHERSEAPMDPGDVEADDEYAWLFKVMTPIPVAEEVTQEADTTEAPLPVPPAEDDQHSAEARIPELEAATDQGPMARPQAGGVASQRGGPQGAPEDRTLPPTTGPRQTTELPTIASSGLPRSHGAVQIKSGAPMGSHSAGSERRIVERPLVDVVDCPSGHPNSPTSPSCRVCGSKVRNGMVRTVPRPALGVLRLVSDSPGAPALIPLDADLVLGRGPRNAHEQGCLPVVVGIPGVDLSRDHLKVALEGWQVVVTDLGSLNGTTVCPEGGVAGPLTGGEPCEIGLGCLVTLADVVTYRFEAPA